MPRVELTFDEVVEFRKWQESLARERFRKWQESLARERKLEAERQERLNRDRIDAERGAIPLTIDVHDVWPQQAKTDPLRWPLINKALIEPLHAARSPKVEWLIDRAPGTFAEGDAVRPSAYFETCNLGHKHLARNAFEQPTRYAEFNYTTIFRVPWGEMYSATALASRRYGSTVGGTPEKKREKMDEMLDIIERAMRLGIRDQKDWYQHAGSVESLLGHWPRPEDSVQFSILRDMQLRRSENKYDGFDVDGRSFDWEYLIELTWIVRAGRKR